MNKPPFKEEWWERMEPLLPAPKLRRLRQALWARGILPFLARRGKERGGGLGAHRAVMERTFAWFRALAVCGCALDARPSRSRLASSVCVPCKLT